VPTGTAATATATSTPGGEPGEGETCTHLSGAPFFLCKAFCELNCDDERRFSCLLIRFLFRKVAGDQPLTCEAPQTASADLCAALTGKQARLCHVFCEKCQTRKLKSSCLRLERHFARIANGAPLPCAG
jgi:hypothetical protein